MSLGGLSSKTPVVSVMLCCLLRPNVIPPFCFQPSDSCGNSSLLVKSFLGFKLFRLYFRRLSLIIMNNLLPSGSDNTINCTERRPSYIPWPLEELYDVYGTPRPAPAIVDVASWMFSPTAQDLCDSCVAEDMVCSVSY